MVTNVAEFYIASSVGCWCPLEVQSISFSMLSGVEFRGLELAEDQRYVGERISGCC